MNLEDSTNDLTNNQLAKLLLDQIKKSEERVTSKFDNLEEKFNTLDTRVNVVETNVSTLKDENAHLKAEIDAIQNNLASLNEFKQMQENNVKAAENRAVMTEFHSKKYNCILYNWPEEQSWETPSDSREQLNIFLEEVLEYPNPEDLKLANTHRLGNIIQSRGPRPMIFRCLFWEDRESILERAGKMLKSYNSENNTKYGVSQQLPKRMQDNKKELWAKFKKARQEKQKAKWRIDYENAFYYLTVNDKPILPSGYSFSKTKPNNVAG